MPLGERLRGRIRHGLYNPAITLAIPWLSGWQYRKSHSINPATGAGTEYQVGIKVYYGSGTDGIETVDGVTFGKVYCNEHCRTDFGDIRFTDDDGTTELSYWMEDEVNSNYAIFWVKVNDSLESDAVTVYVYYGKSDATTTSSGTDTFALFDHFDDGSIGAIWTPAINGVGVLTESGTTLKADTVSIATGSYAKVTSVGQYANNTRIKAKSRFKALTTDYVYLGHGYVDGSAEDGTGFVDAFLLRSNALGASRFESDSRKDGGTIDRQDVDGYITDDGSTYVILQWKYTNGICVLDIDGTDRITHNTSDGTPTTDPMHVCIGYRNHAAIMPTTNEWVEVDYIFVTKYVSPEPSHGSWGVEESAS